MTPTKARCAPWEITPYGVVSLLEMADFAAIDFIEISHAFGALLALTRKREVNPDAISRAISSLTVHSCNLGLTATCQHCINLAAELSGSNSPNVAMQQAKDKVFFGTMTPERMLHHVETLYTTMYAELEGLRFKAIPRERVRFSEEDWLSDLAIDSFPTAHEELRRAGACYSLGESTATVFHSMRALESGLNALADRFDVPFTHDNWQNVIEAIESKIREVGRLKRTPSRIEAEKILGSAASNLYFVKNAWRNHVAHVRDNYSDSDALKILSRTSDFVESLSPHLCEPGAFDSMKKNPEFERFDKMMGALLSVPHDKVKAELEAEKKAKAVKRNTKKHASSSGRASRDKG